MMQTTGMNSMYNGFLIVNKEAGCTSFDVVARLRKICGQKKIGHTGTLDPDAVGVLVICLGKATRASAMLTGEGKTYIASMRFGLSTDTQDISGKVLRTADPSGLNRTQVERALLSFSGRQMQVPPMYSALKVNGQKLCDLARAGKEVYRDPRPVEFSNLEILSEDLPDITFRVSCSKGTYIRTLCSDLGDRLGCGGTMTALQRIASGGFHIEDAHTLAEIESMQKKGTLEDIILPIDSVFRNLPACRVTEDLDILLKNGGKIPAERLNIDRGQDRCRMYASDERFIAVYRREEDRFRPDKMFI